MRNCCRCRLWFHAHINQIVFTPSSSSFPPSFACSSIVVFINNKNSPKKTHMYGAHGVNPLNKRYSLLNEYVSHLLASYGAYLFFVVQIHTTTSVQQSAAAASATITYSKYVCIVVRRINNRSIWYVMLCYVLGFHSHSYMWASERVNECVSVSACMYASYTQQTPKEHTLYERPNIRKTHKCKKRNNSGKNKRKSEQTNQPTNERTSERAGRQASKACRQRE